MASVSRRPVARLLVSLRVKTNETKSWFGFASMRGRPVLDRARQILRIDDISVDTESQARPGCSVSQPERLCLTSIRPRAAGHRARRNIAKAIADFQRNIDAFASS